MDNLRNKLIFEIRNFVELGYWLTNLFSDQYNFDGSPIRNTTKYKGCIPFYGILASNRGDILYQFHGYGCRFVLPSEQIIEIAYPPPTWQYNGLFNFYSIQEYVQLIIPEFSNPDLLEDYFTHLENAKLIVAVKDIHKPTGKISPKFNAYQLVPAKPPPNQPAPHNDQ